MWTPEQRAAVGRKIRERPGPNRGKKLSKEWRANISAAGKGRKVWNKGVPMSEEQKEKLSGSRGEISREGTSKRKKQQKQLSLPWKMPHGNIGKKRPDVSKMMTGNRRAVGAARSKELRERISMGVQNHIASSPSNCQCGPHKIFNRSERTSLELKLRTLLVDFPEVQEQKQFGRYCVDAYLPPPYHLAFEADGAYWHQQPKQDAARDAHLMKHFDLPVVRLAEQDLEQKGRE